MLGNAFTFVVSKSREQRALGLANFKFVVYPGDDPNYVCTYVEHGSKNRCGGLGDHRVENKKVPCLGAKENILKCLSIPAGSVYEEATRVYF